MENNAFAQLVDWAQSQIGHYAMTGYVAEYHEKEPIAEVTISVADAIYKAQFCLLAGKQGPAPQRIALQSSTMDELMEWLKTGNDSSD